MATLKLHDLELSGNCYKVRLFCALLGLDLEVVSVDFMAGGHKKSPIIDMNPFGEIPVLEDGDVVLRDSQAILVYLARKYGGETWLPIDPAGVVPLGRDHVEPALLCHPGTWPATGSDPAPGPEQ